MPLTTILCLHAHLKFEMFFLWWNHQYPLKMYVDCITIQKYYFQCTGFHLAHTIILIIYAYIAGHGDAETETEVKTSIPSCSTSSADESSGSEECSCGETDEDDVSQESFPFRTYSVMISSHGIVQDSSKILYQYRLHWYSEGYRLSLIGTRAI